MLSLTRRTDYALIALVHLTQDHKCCCSAREISEKYGIPLPLLMNILKLLTQRGLARSSRGPRGGYNLACDPDEITLNDIITAVEGPIQLVQCVECEGDESENADQSVCELEGTCPIRSPVQMIHERLIEFLSDVTLRQIAEDSTCCQETKLTIGGVPISDEPVGLK